MLVQTKDSKDGIGLYLGTQTYPGFEMKEALWKAAVWAPKRAKTFAISEFRLEDYHGRSVEISTGHSSFYVLYYSTATEGEHKVADYLDKYKKALDTERFDWWRKREIERNTATGRMLKELYAS